MRAGQRSSDRVQMDVRGADGDIGTRLCIYAPALPSRRHFRPGDEIRRIGGDPGSFFRLSAMFNFVGVGGIVSSDWWRSVVGLRGLDPPLTTRRDICVAERLT